LRSWGAAGITGRPWGTLRSRRPLRPGGNGVDEILEAVELPAHLDGVDLGAGLGKVGVEHRLGEVEWRRRGEEGANKQVSTLHPSNESDVIRVF
jgi:hypothetical protein